MLPCSHASKKRKKRKVETCSQRGIKLGTQELASMPSRLSIQRVEAGHADQRRPRSPTRRAGDGPVLNIFWFGCEA